MGKNRKNRSQNIVDLDEIDKIDKIDKIDDNNSDNLANRKQNLFSQLDNIDDMDDTKQNNTENIKKNPDKYFAKGYHYDDYEHDYEKAIEQYKLSLENDDVSYHGVAAYNMALLYENNLNDNVNAEHYYKIACSYKYKDSFASLAQLYFKQKKYDISLGYFESSIKLGNVYDFYEYAICLEKCNKKQDSLKYLQYHLLLKNASISEKKMFSRLIKIENLIE
jgi:tetratricopeptide (TPR) repeat protein